MSPVPARVAQLLDEDRRSHDAPEASDPPPLFCSWLDAKELADMDDMAGINGSVA